MSDSGSDEEEDDYEPAEADADMSQPIHHSDGESDEYDPEHITPSAVADDDELDFYEPVENIEEMEHPPNEDASNVVEGAQTVSAVSTDTKQDDTESGLQLTEADPLVNTHTASNGDEPGPKTFLDGSSQPSTHFIPYKTPLSAFKTYRFHADFNENVKDGYRSLTYSNNIDPSRPLCPTELSGETCTDNACEDQHFSQLGLPGMSVY